MAKKKVTRIGVASYSSSICGRSTARMREGFSRLRELLSGEELDEIVKAGTEFRERFKIR